MSYFLYFMPEIKGSPEGRLPSSLQDYGSDSELSYRDTFVGPTGATGVIFAFKPFGFTGDEPAIGYYKDKQTWIKTGADDDKRAFWIGIQNDLRPTPKGLARQEILYGKKLILGDGASWEVPIIRYYDGSTGLPRTYNYQSGAWVLGDVLGKYRKIFDDVCAVWDKTISGDTQNGLIVLNILEVVVEALQLNYRVTPDGVSMLNLFNTQNQMEAFKVLIDFEGALALKKKIDVTSINS